MAQKLRWFLFSLGVYSWDYPNVAELETTFIDGSRKEITETFIPYENLLKEDSMENLMSFLTSVEERFERGEKVNFNCIQVSKYAVTFNPFSPELQLFMRDV